MKLLRLIVCFSVIFSASFVLVASCSQKPDDDKSEKERAVLWLLELSRRDIFLPNEVSLRNVVDCYYLGGFGDSDVIMKIQLDPKAVEGYMHLCDNLFPKIDDESVVLPDEFESSGLGKGYKLDVNGSVSYFIWFSDGDGNSLVIRRIKY